MEHEFNILDEAARAGRPWAIRPEVLAALASLDGTVIQLPSAEEMEAAEARRRERGPQRVAGGAVAVVPLKGVISPQGSFIQMLLGIPGGLERFKLDLGEAMADNEVKSIVLDVDSPGGIVDQVPETAAMIRAARRTKPIVAVANPLMASAAYWLASQSTQVVGSTSSETGSIGVYQLHRDLSGAHAQAGIVPTLIKAGKFKVEGNPFEPLSDEAQAALQRAVDDYYALFTKDVAAGRGVAQDAVKNGFGEGRVLTAPRAKRASLIDAIDTLEGVVGSLGMGKLPANRAHHGDALGDFSHASGQFDLIEAKEPDNNDDFSYQEAPDYSSAEKERVFETLLA